MAVTGVVLFGFVIGHMVGNLQLYLGAEAINAYAVFLRELLHGGGLWIARAVLLASVGLHIWAAASLTIADRAARPVGYREWEARESTYASRTMRWSGRLPARLRRLPPARPHVRRVEPELRAGRRLPQRGRELPRPAGVALLHRGHAAPRGAPPPRGVEHAPDARAQPSALRGARAPRRGGLRDPGRARQHLLSARRPLRRLGERSA